MAKTFITSGTGASQTLDAIQNEKVPVYNTRAAAEADIANIEEGAIVATKDTGATEKVVDVVEDGNMNPVTSNAVYDAIDEFKIRRKTVRITFNSPTVSVPLSEIGVSGEKIIAAHYREGASGVSAYLTGIDLTENVALIRASPDNGYSYNIDFFYIQ